MKPPDSRHDLAGCVDFMLCHAITLDRPPHQRFKR
jgi:hypothetical protein